MADNNHSRNAEEITRREHNEPAMAKRALGVGFDSVSGEYKALSLNGDGKTVIHDERVVVLLKSIYEEQRITNELLAAIASE